MWVDHFNNHFQYISTPQKNDILNLNKNIFKIVDSIFIVTNTNNLFFCSNILKYYDLIIYKNIFIVFSSCIFNIYIYKYI